MKSQVIRIKSTPVLRQLPGFTRPLTTLRRAYAPCRQQSFDTLDGLENAPGTLPASLLRVIR